MKVKEKWSLGLHFLNSTLFLTSKSYSRVNLLVDLKVFRAK